MVKRTKSKLQGFTLVEVLAVMFIIAVAFAALQPNFGGDERRDQLKHEAERWSVILELLSQEAVLTGQDFGVAFHTNGAEFFLHKPLTLEEIEEMRKTVSEKKPRHEWQPYQETPFGYLELPEQIGLVALIEGQSAKLKSADFDQGKAKSETDSKDSNKKMGTDINDDEEPEPHVVFFSGGEQPILELTFFWDDVTDDDPPNVESVLSGDGLGRFRVSEKDVDEF